MTNPNSIVKAREARARRISEIEQALARPDQGGPEWDKRRKELERELDWLKTVVRRKG